MPEQTFQLGEFVLTRPLGEGGMAEVWAGQHVETGEEVAVKVMLARAAGTPGLRAGFAAEARSHAGLEHVNIVPLLDFGVVRTEDRPPQDVTVDDPYLVMQIADGTARDARFDSWAKIKTLLEHVLTGLAYSHARGLVHRDLKPENVLTFDDGRLFKLADFGIAHSVNLDETATRETLSITVGTPHYMAPEQFRGHWYDFGPSTDLYALGCVAYELVAGRVPFTHTTLFKLAVAHLNEPPPPLVAQIEVPPGFGGWLGVLLRKRPADRYQFAAEALADLRELSSGFDGGVPQARTLSALPEVAHDASTLVDALTDFATDETIDIVDLALPATEGEGVLRPAARALPADWRGPESGAARRWGLGLFALRETPLVGFDEVRDQLWAGLVEASSSSTPRVLILHGEQSATTRALGTWLCRRAAETAAAVTRETFYTRTGGPREGIVALLEDSLGTWGMHDHEVAERVSAYTAAHIDELVAAPCAALVTEIVLAARGAERSAQRVPTRGERHRAVAEILESTATDRPYLAWIADVQWGHEALVFARRLQERSVPGLLVLGVSDGELDARGRALLEELARLEFVSVARIRPATLAEDVEQVQAMLPVPNELARSLVDVTDGDPVAVRLALDQFRAAKQLVRGADGYGLTSDASAPRSIAEIFIASVARFASTHGRLRDALEVAAVLGRAPDTTELVGVGERLGVSTAGLREALVDQGLARAVGERWWFVHDAVAEVVVQTSHAQGDAPRIHRACAEYLLSRGDGAVGVLLRASRHLLAAGDMEAALSPMFRAMRMLLSEDLPRVASILTTYDEVCDDLGLTVDSRPRLEGALIRMAQMRTDGEVFASRELAEETVRAAKAGGHELVLGVALRHLARLAVGSREFSEAAHLLRQAEDAAKHARLVGEQAAAAAALGAVYDQLGNFADASDALTRAASLYSRVPDHAAHARTLGILGSVLMHAGHLNEAQTSCEAAMQSALAAGGAGAAEASNMLGDLARMRGQFGQARERYRDARARLAFGAQFNLRIVDLNLALVDLAQGLFEDAAPPLAALHAEFERAQLTHIAAIADAGLAVCHLARGRTADASERLDAIRASLGGGADPDVAEVLAVGCALLDWPTMLAEFLLHQYQELGNQSGAAAVRARFSP